MICTTKFYEKGIAQNYSHGFKYDGSDQIIVDDTGITKDFRDTPILKDNYKDYLYEDINLKDEYITNGIEKIQYKYQDEIIDNKSFSGFSLVIYGIPKEPNTMFNFYKVLLDEIEYEIKKEGYKRIIIGKPIEKYIHGPWDKNNEFDYETEIIIPYRWEYNDENKSD